MGLGDGIADFYGLASQAFVAIHCHKTVFLFLFIGKPDESVAFTVASIVKNHWKHTRMLLLIYTGFLWLCEITQDLSEASHL